MSTLEEGALDSRPAPDLVAPSPVVAPSRLHGARLRAARARFGIRCDVGDRSATLGSIILRPDQLHTLRRVRAGLARDGGCVLAEEVGTGKTYVALAAAAEWRRPIAVVPASLRATWESAMRRSGVECTLVTHESLSRGVAPAPEFDIIVVDESHRFRATARRHAVLASLAARSSLLLISATPLQNHERELAAQLALFLGEQAYTLDPAAMTGYVVRSAPRASPVLPKVADPRWLRVAADDGHVLRAILALPPPPRVVDAGDGGALLLISLVRAWASSRAALLASVRRRSRTLVAIEQCVDAGRIPTRDELKAWRGDADVQLGFAALLAESTLGGAAAAPLRTAMHAERGALDALLDALHRTTDPDVARAETLRRLRREHPGASILAFSESAATVRAYHSAMRNEPGVGMLTSHEGRIATGRVPRAELLARFAPRAQGAPEPAPHDRVTLLVTTDLLAEGMNLQDAAVVVHLDLPWNPARLAQRLGRVRRPGGAVEVFSYLLSPPADASLLLRTDDRLRSKLARAEGTIGRGLAVLPQLVAPSLLHHSAAPGVEAVVSHGSGSESHAELRGEIDRVLTRWRGGGDRRASRSRHCIHAAAFSSENGWVASLGDGRIVAAVWTPDRGVQGDRGSDAEGASEDALVVARALTLADGPARIAPWCEVDRARRALARHLDREWAATSSGIGSEPPALRTLVRRRLDDIVQRLPRHVRATGLIRASRLRALLELPLPLGIERELLEHVQRSRQCDQGGAHDLQSTSWALDWMTDACAMLIRPRIPLPHQREQPSVIALIVFGSESMDST